MVISRHFRLSMPASFGRFDSFAKSVLKRERYAAMLLSRALSGYCYDAAERAAAAGADIFFADASISALRFHAFLPRAVTPPFR